MSDNLSAEKRIQRHVLKQVVRTEVLTTLCPDGLETDDQISQLLELLEEDHSIFMKNILRL